MTITSASLQNHASHLTKIRIRPVPSARINLLSSWHPSWHEFKSMEPELVVNTLLAHTTWHVMCLARPHTRLRLPPPHRSWLWRFLPSTSAILMLTCRCLPASRVIAFAGALSLQLHPQPCHTPSPLLVDRTHSRVLGSVWRHVRNVPDTDPSTGGAGDAFGDKHQDLEGLPDVAAVLDSSTSSSPVLPCERFGPPAVARGPHMPATRLGSTMMT